MDFGTTLDEYPGNKDVNIIFAAARSYLQKTGGICIVSELENMANSAELIKRISDFLAKREDQLYVHNGRIKEIFHGILQSQTVIDCLPEMSHISFFLPLPYSRLDQVNKAYAESEAYSDLSLHWISLA